jgi:uncharacterized protein
VQLQKLFFLIDRNISGSVGGPFFDFQLYMYGPFDKAVYDEVTKLVSEGLIETIPEGRWNSYKLTALGRAKSHEEFSSLPNDARAYIQSAVSLVQRLSFRQLVSAIYRVYPEMRANSVFTE